MCSISADPPRTPFSAPKRERGDKARLSPDLLTEEKSNVLDLGGPSENALLGTGQLEYNEHGELIEEIEVERAVTTTRTGRSA